MKHYVIIGGGIASAGCIEGIRSVDAQGSITLISGEGRPVYCRPLISYYLQGKTDFEKMKYRPDGFYHAQRCEVLSGKAAAIDAGCVVLEDGSRVPYDALCVATGSMPFVPPFAGLDTVERKFTFMTEDDALALESAIRPESRVLIVGAGMIGLKCAEGLHGRVESLTVCDMATHVLPSVLDDLCAARIQQRLEENGITFLLDDGAERFARNRAFFKSGRTADFDILVLAVGVRPNTALFQSAGGDCGKGISADTRMRTSLAGVYAAGDCVEGYDCATGAARVLANLPNAYMQGHCAGENMAGGEAVFDNGIVMNAIGFFGLHALTAGSYDGELHEQVTETGIRRLYVKDCRLVGFMLVGDVTGAGVYTAMIRKRTPLNAVDFEMLCAVPSLAAFSAETRGKLLGEVV